MAAPEEEDYYYVDSQNERQGPLSVNDLKQAYKQKLIKDETLMFGWPGQEDWQPLCELSELKKLLEPRAPPPLPTKKSGPPPLPSRSASSSKESTKAPATNSAAAAIAAHFGGKKAQPKQSESKAASNVPTKATETRKPAGGMAALLSDIKSNSGKPVRSDTAASVKSPQFQAKQALPGLGRPKQATEVQSSAAGQETKPDKPQKFFSAVSSSKKRTTTAHPDSWVEKRTADGIPYYHNTTSGALLWEKPEELKSERERQDDGAQWVWIPDEKRAWAPARLLGDVGKTKVKVQTKEGLQKEITTKNCPLWQVDRTGLHDICEIADLVQLRDLNEAMIIHCLHERFQRDEIYTWVGSTDSVLISLNPFKLLPIYTPAVIEMHAKASEHRRPPPHVFDIANACYRDLRLNNRSQSILISGESGAGKTEAAKQCLTFLAETAGSENNVEQKLLQSNPVLEAFGNAKTLRNNNSSRFGKWVEYYISDSQGDIVGARIENYLLEKSRMVAQQPGERNYHIFYQLMNGEYPQPPSDSLETAEQAWSSLGSKFGLGSDATSWAYLVGGASEAAAALSSADEWEVAVEGVDDAADFAEVLDAFRDLGFSQIEQHRALAIIAALMYAGNLKFKALDEGSQLHQSNDTAQAAAKLLCVDPDNFSDTVCHRSITIRGTTTKIPLKPDQAQSACDALSKTIYSRLFDWLVARINTAVKLDSNSRPRGQNFSFIGVLDIFGFEIFEVNSFEQLCINYANEKLQQHFNNHTFKEEVGLYRAEGVPVPDIEFIDNQPVLDLIEGKAKAGKPAGILVQLDDECKVPKGSDQTFVQKVIQAHSSHSALSTDARTRFRSGCGFTVVHYAGNVNYDAADFLLKNKDKLLDDMAKLMVTSKSPLIKQLFDKERREAEEAEHAESPARRAKLTSSLGGQFRKQLDRLMEDLYKTEPHYIRCVKTTPAKRPNDMRPQMCIEQLRYSGVFEAVQIRKQGYPFRHTHQAFALRYSCVSDAAWKMFLKDREAGRLDWRKLCETIIKQSGQDLSGVHIGASLILYRAEQHRLLELMRHLALEPRVLHCQRAWRGGLARRYVKRVREVNPILQDAISQRTSIPALDEAIEKAAEILDGLQRCFVTEAPFLAAAKDLRHKLQECQKLEKILEDLLRHEDVNKIYPQLAAAVKRTEAALDVPHTSKLDDLYANAKEALRQCAAAIVDPAAAEASWLLDRQKMEGADALAKEYDYISDEVKELRRLLSLTDEEFTKLQLRRAVEMKDPVRRINREIKLQNMYLDAHGIFFTLETFPRLRGPEEFAHAMKLAVLRSTRREELERSYLSWSDKPIPTSLTALEQDVSMPKQAQKSIKCSMRWFKSLHMWCGERRCPDPESVASEMLREVHNDTSMRSEAYAQVMKQLTNNPHPGSIDKAWQMMYLLLRSAPVPSDCENHVLVFIRQHAPTNPPRNDRERLITTVHESKYEKERTTPPPSRDQIVQWISAYSQQSFHRSQYSTSDDVITVHAPRPIHEAASRTEQTTTSTGKVTGMKQRTPLNTQTQESTMPGHQRKISSLSERSSPRPTSSKFAAPSRTLPPAPPIPLSSPRKEIVVAMYDFEKAPEDAPDTLSMSAGDEMTVLAKEGDWWRVRMHTSGLEGFIPGTFVQHKA